MDVEWVCDLLAVCVGLRKGEVELCTCFHICLEQQNRLFGSTVRGNTMRYSTVDTGYDKTKP